MMKQGGKARFIFPSSLGYGRISFGNVPPYSSLIFDIELIHVIKNIIQFERAKLNSYLIANSITEDSTSTGLYYHEILAGTGDFPVTGKTVNMSYKGSFLDGKVFSESDGDNLFTVGYNQVIPGVDEGIRFMKKGGKAIIIIPYYLAYGADGYVTQSNNDVFTLVYPYTTLVYEIELKDIQ
jgi:FKBP-type peptidyl-prolyl cis-trans isomerase